MTTPKSNAHQPRLDAAFKRVTLAAAFAIVILMLGIVAVLIVDGRESIAKWGFAFLASKAWNPVTGDFGAAASIYGTAVSTAIAIIIAAPLGLAISLFLVELAPKSIGRVLGGAVELLAAVPSIIFGMWGLFVFAPFMSNYIEPALGKSLGWLPLFQGPPMGIGMLSAGIILALMILPYISAIGRDVLEMVPPVLKESAHGLGSTRWEVIRHVSLPYGLHGIAGAILLGLGRAIGETMAVTFVIGNDHVIHASLFLPANTIASNIANEFSEATEAIYRSSLVELGLVLFLLSTTFQVLAYLWLAHLRRRYGR